MTQFTVKDGREKKRLQRAYFFGHYDSRGGAMLVLADNFVKALLKYAEGFGYAWSRRQGPERHRDRQRR